MLRDVLEGDLPTFLEHQQDPEATSLAAHRAKEWDAFPWHWRHEVFGDRAAEARTILVDARVAGYVASWAQDGRRLPGCWLGRESWGEAWPAQRSRRQPAPCTATASVTGAREHGLRHQGRG